jgi:DNA-binding SARP family transcriptional activator
MAHKELAPLDTRDFAVLGRMAFLSGLGPFPDGIDHALDVLRVGAEADACELFLLDATGKELLLVGCTGPDAEAFSSQEHFDLGKGFPGIAAQSQVVISTLELPSDTRFLRKRVTQLGYTALACAPVTRGGRVMGTLHLAWKRPNPNMARGLRLLDAAGPTIGTTLVASYADLLMQPAPDAPAEKRRGLDALAERFRAAGKADSATLVYLGAGDEEAVLGSSGKELVLCANLRSGLKGCPSRLRDGRSHVLRGERSKWARHCRSLPAGFSRIIEVPLVHDGATVAVAVLGYVHDSIAPSTRWLGSLRTVADDVVLHIRTALPEAQTLPVETTKTSRLRLHCLGPFTAIVDGRTLTRKDFVRGKAIELLKVLVMMRGRPISRDALVERLWPDSDLKSGARSLHVAMHALRRAIEPKVAGRQWVHVRNLDGAFYLDLTHSCFVDVEEFRRLLALSHPGRGRPADKVIAVLERINGLYRGRLFADDPHADWCQADRENLHEEYVDALVRLADLSSRHGDSERTISLLRQVSLMEPLREDVHRQLIRSLWSDGRRGEARERYEACIRILRQDLGVGPSDETRKLGKLVWRAS